MPTTRRAAARGRAAVPAKGQSTISFTGRVTKAVPKDLAKAVIDSPTATTSTIPERPATAKEEKTDEVPIPDVVVHEPKEEVEEEELEEEEVEVKAEPVPEKTEAELKAEKITTAQIGAYWRGIEKLRKAPRVHQEGLGVSEKVLRYFDVSSQYGPCIGIPRMKRWQRAERLGLNPPIEVLAVLIKEDNKENEEVHTAHMDRIMNSAALPE